MTQNNFDELNNKSETKFLPNKMENDLNQLKDEIGGTFEYKNRSRNWEYFVFAYNTHTWEKTNDIKQKYVDQYWWDTEWLIITDERGKEIQEWEIEASKRIYIKVKIDEYPSPITFINFWALSWKKWEYTCFINIHWWDPNSIRQIYQDEFNVTIKKENIIISDREWKVYDESTKFKPWDIVVLKITQSNSDNNYQQENIQSKTDEGKNLTWENQVEQNELENWVSKYKDMIENQWIPVSHWDKNNPDISLTFDDGYWRAYIENILDTLKWSWIHATFFLLWECIKNTPDLRKRAIKEWHQICCHTYSHAYLSEWKTTDLFKWHWILDSNRPWLIKSREGNVKRLLWQDYYDNIKSKNPWVPERMNSVDLLETEILMWEEQVKRTLWEQYLSEMKQNFPFFRFPWGCWTNMEENIDVLKKHWFLAIWWNGEPIRNMPDIVSNWDIPLFHFNQKNVNVLETYISRMQNSWKNPKLISEIIKP